jgi:hypothetical protein
LRLEKPIDLFLYCLVKPTPLFSVVFGRELPKYFPQILIQDWISEVEDIHCHHKYVEEIENQRLHLLFVDTNTEHVGKHNIVSEYLQMEEERHQ